jgi:hypothetical protein
LDIPNSPVLGIVRSGYGKKLLFLANAHPLNTTEVSVPLQSTKPELKELISGEMYRIGNDVLTVRLGGGESAWFEL